MSHILVNIYDIFLSIVLEIVETYFLSKYFLKSYISVFFLSKKCRTGSRKTSIPRESLVIESCPNPCWVTFLIFCWLVYDISSHLNDPVLAWSASLQVSQQNARLVYDIFQFQKQEVSGTWHTDSNLIISVSRGTEIYVSHEMK